MKRVVVEAPASSANLGPGFDVFALALDRPRDTIILDAEDGKGKLSIRLTQIDGAPVPLSAGANCIEAVCRGMASEHGIKARLRVEVKKRVPIGLGMGSSGASAAAAAVAMDKMFGLDLTHDDLIFYAGMGEEVTSGVPHYDNVSASVMGGFVIVRCGERSRPSALRFDPPEGMALCVATPAVKLPGRKTEYARSILPGSLGLRSLVSNIANASTVVAGFATGSIELIGRGMDDKVVEVARKEMIPGFETVKAGALDAGASGVCISGAGPSMLAIVDGNRIDPERVLEAMLAGFKASKVDVDGFVTKVGGGASTVDVEEDSS